MAEKVWVSDSFLNSSIVSHLSVVADILLPSVNPAERKRLDELQKKYSRGEGLSDDERYASAYGVYKDTRIKTLPNFFKINGFFAVSAAFAETLSRFDLGKSGLCPIDLFQGNRTERIPGEWYFLNIACVKEAFLPEKSSGGYTHPTLWPEGRWMIQKPKDGEIALSTTALRGCDLWIDPRLDGAFFLSGRLEATLKAAKLTRTIRRALCSVESGS